MLTVTTAPSIDVPAAALSKTNSTVLEKSPVTSLDKYLGIL